MNSALQPTFKIVKKDELTPARFNGIDYYFHKFTHTPAEKTITATMHVRENTNNLEVLKLALYCRALGIRLCMFGSANQFPLFSIFADEMIFERDRRHALSAAYDDIGGTERHTTYEPPTMPPLIKAADLTRESEFIALREPIHDRLRHAMSVVSDDEVVAAFANATIHVREWSYEVFDELSRHNTFQPDRIIFEMKECASSHGAALRDTIAKQLWDYGIDTESDRSKQAALCETCREHYMAVQLLASIFYNWTWLCYGGSSNLFAFFPVKKLLLSDAYVWPDLSRKMSAAKWGSSGFPLINEEQNLLTDMSPELAERIRTFVSQ